MKLAFRDVLAWLPAKRPLLSLESSFQDEKMPGNGVGHVEEILPVLKSVLAYNDTLTSIDVLKEAVSQPSLFPAKFSVTLSGD